MRWIKQHHHPSSTRHFVDHGSVGCPVRHHDVDVDTCLMCTSFEEVAEDGDTTVLYCRPPAARLDVFPF